MYITFARFTLSQQFVYSIIGFAFAHCCKTLRNCNEIEILLAGSAMKRALRENWRVFLPMCVFFCSQCVIRLKISGLRYLDTEYHLQVFLLLKVNCRLKVNLLSAAIHFSMTPL